LRGAHNAQEQLFAANPVRSRRKAASVFLESATANHGALRRTIFRFRVPSFSTIGLFI
jgi:hypothetical protein